MPDAEYFDSWYADMARSQLRDAIFERALGLPPSMQSTSLLPWSGISSVIDELRLSPGDVLLDLACGRGGYGLEVARRIGVDLVGVDFSAVALEEARRHAGDVDAEFVTGDLTAIPLPDDSVRAVMCVDAIQFAEPRSIALAEVRRVLVPGGRVALTCWEPVGGDEGMHPRLQGIDLGLELEQAGFADVRVIEQPGWSAAERQLWQAALETDAPGDPAIESLQKEAQGAVSLAPRLRRVLATATAA